MNLRHGLLPLPSPPPFLANHPDPGPKRSRPTFRQQHETDLGRAVACLAGWPSVTRPRSIHTSILPSESSTYQPEPVSQSTMARKRKGACRTLSLALQGIGKET